MELVWTKVLACRKLLCAPVKQRQKHTETKSETQRQKQLQKSSILMDLTSPGFFPTDPPNTLRVRASLLELGDRLSFSRSLWIDSLGLI